MTDLAPDLPDLPDESTLLTRFRASLPRAFLTGTTNGGQPIIKFIVAEDDKWLPMLLQEGIGLELVVECWVAPGPAGDDDILDEILGA